MTASFAGGTWGEWVQGVDEAGPFLVSVPSRAGTWSTVGLTPRSPRAAPVQGGGPLVQRGVAHLLHRLGQPDVTVHVHQHRRLPVGVGRASSSADLLSALHATARALGRPLSPAALCALAVELEPTNPTLLPGWSLFRQCAGTWLGSAPEVPLWGLPRGYTHPRSTRAHHQQAPSWTAGQRREAKRALAMLQQGCAQRSPELVALAATRSACLAAERGTAGIDVQALREEAAAMGALGISISHSGTGGVLWFSPTRHP